MKTKRILMALLAVIILLTSAGLTFQPAQAASCSSYHFVSHGQTLSWIGRYYGVNWKYLADINNIPPPYKIFPGQRICISGAGSTYYYPTYYPTNNQWSYVVTSVERDISVTIKTANMPDNVLFEVSIGRKQSGSMNWMKVADLDSDRGGSFKAAFDIPDEFAGASTLSIKLVQAKKNKSLVRSFSNASYTSGTGGPYYPYYNYGNYYYGTIPTIWIQSVVRDSTVTIRTANFPSGMDFQVLMGPMGSAGIGGYYVTTFNSGAGGAMTLTFNIPPQLYGSHRIAIRTQNQWSGFYSYNWFYNNTTN
jgi:LysM repeat protein